MFFYQLSICKKVLFSLRMTSHLKQCWYFWKQIWKYDRFFCKGFKFHLFLWIIGIFLSKVTYFIVISHIVNFFYELALICFWWSHLPFSKRKKWFPWKQFFFHETVYSVYFRLVYSLITSKTKIWFRKLKNWFWNWKQTARKHKCLITFSTLSSLTEISTN